MVGISLTMAFLWHFLKYVYYRPKERIAIEKET